MYLRGGRGRDKLDPLWFREGQEDDEKDRTTGFFLERTS